MTATARPGFDVWRAQLWSDAEQFGIRRKTFDAALKGVKPDLSLPDLLRSSADARPSKGQAEFTRPPQAYVSEKSIARLAVRGSKLAIKHKTTLEKIEHRFGVPRAVVLAIWGRETAYGQYRLRHDAIRALATQAYAGRRHEMFRQELLHALKMLDDGVIPRSKFRSSWAGAVGLTQFMPSEYASLAVDLEGDGRKDIWSVPDALASAANQLKQKGWVPKQPWGYEVLHAVGVTCAEDGPAQTKSIKDWVRLGVHRVARRTFPTEAMARSAFLFSPGGGKGPVFLATENFLVFKRYNLSDLYALFVGHLSDRIAGGGRFVKSWGAIKQLPSKQIMAIQEVLKKEGLPIGAIDGRIGPNTRSQIGQYQLSRKLPVDCWPSARLLRTMRKELKAAKKP
jgi:lytic murein transglycosylase